MTIILCMIFFKISDDNDKAGCSAEHGDDDDDDDDDEALDMEDYAEMLESEDNVSIYLLNFNPTLV